MAPSVADRIGSLPHWARVAFAARCGRVALPLFRRSWPDASRERVDSLELAVRLAERSAENASMAVGLKAAKLGAVVTAGAALSPVYGMAREGSAPVGENACHAASFAAKVAEWAAEAALADPRASANAALEAHAFCRDAAEAAGVVDVPERLRADFDDLCRAAAGGRWSDGTPVPPSVFDSWTREARDEPRWRFW